MKLITLSTALYELLRLYRFRMLRNSFKYVNYNNLKKFSKDFKAVYNAPNESAALAKLEAVKETWRKKYPYAISNQKNNWEGVSSSSNSPGISEKSCIPATL